jgi:DNA-nicking Smr family endonuclease
MSKRRPPPSPPGTGDDIAAGERADPDIGADDAALFRAAIGPVRALPERTPPPSKPKPAPTTRMRDRDEADALDSFRRALDSPLLAGDTLSYRRHEVAPQVLRRLARGDYAAQDELDLHAVDAATATAMLRQFMKEARQTGMGCVRIIHGKGLNSPDGVPTIKNMVDRLLRQRADVLAFHSAPPAQGGTGAVLVLIDGR